VRRVSNDSQQTLQIIALTVVRKEKKELVRALTMISLLSSRMVPSVFNDYGRFAV